MAWSGALIDVPNGMLLNGTIFTYGTSAVLNGTGDRVALIAEAHKSGTIDRIGFRTGTVTTGDTVDVRIETVGTTGPPAMPSGTLWDNAAPTSNKTQVIADANDDVWFEVTLDAGAVVTRGDRFAVVISAATFASSGDLILASMSALGSTLIPNSPYTVANLTGSYALFAHGLPWSIRYSDGTYMPIGPMAFPWKTLGSEAVDSGGNSRRGIRFQAPAALSVAGAWMCASPASGANYALVLRSDGGTELATTGERDADRSAASSTRVTRALFTSSVTLTKDTWYRLLLEPTTAADVTLHYATVDAQAMIAAWAPTHEWYATHWDGDEYIDTATTTVNIMGLLVDGTADASGGGGGPLVGSSALISA